MTVINPSAWSLGAEPVLRGPAPTGAITVADLSGEGLERAVELFVPHTGGVRKATITTVHYALAVAMRTVVEPFVRDQVLVAAGADQVGFVADPDLDDFAYWVGDVTVTTSTDAAAAGRQVGEVLRPVIDAIRRRARVGRKGVELVVLDSLIDQVRRLDRDGVRPLDSPWVRQLIDATELRSDVAQRHLRVIADHGEPLEFSVPRVCCVLSTRLGDHACPTCPMYPDDATRGRVVATWLAGMDDTEFAEVTGRPRIGAAVVPPPVD